jgi:glucan phosphoethanolaminetransferase (alkaline phosphatase superfamily)
MKFLKLTILFLILSTAFITFYQQTNHSRIKMVVYHELVIGAGILLLFFAGLFFSSSKNRVINIIYGLMWAMFSLLILISYGMIWVGKITINAPLTYKIFWIYLKDFNETVQSLDIPLWKAITACIIIPLVLISVFVRSASKLINDISLINKSLARFIRYRVKGNNALKNFLLVILFLTISLVVYLMYRSSPLERLKNAFEPVTLIFFPPAHNGINLTLDPGSIRTQYPKNIPFKKKNVILISIDALRADYLSMYGYPENLSPFLTTLFIQKKIKKIDFVFATAPTSFLGILSILRSKSGNQLNINNFAIHELLQDQGYRINFILSGDHTNFLGLKSLYGKSIDYYFDGSQSKKYSINNDSLLIEGLTPIKEYDTTPAFFYFHLMSVHSLGRKFLENNSSNLKGTYSQRYVEKYRKGLSQADNFIKTIFNILNQKGYLNNAIVIITADHGESLGEHNKTGHNNNLYNTEIRIPLLIYDADSSYIYPASKPAIQPDIAATIIDRLGLPIPPSWEGKSLLSPDLMKFSFHHWINHYAIILYQNRQMFKYHFDINNGQEELYELNPDINEQHNLKDSIPYQPVLDILREKMKDFTR